jgi:hypothetical protein
LTGIFIFLLISILEGLQNYWTFDNHTNDVVGCANLKNGVNASFSADRSGNNNSAVYLNFGYYEAPVGVYFKGDHTVSVWVKLLTISSYARIIDFGNGIASDNIVLAISYNSTGQPYILQFSTQTLHCLFFQTSP